MTRRQVLRVEEALPCPADRVWRALTYVITGIGCGPGGSRISARRIGEVAATLGSMMCARVRRSLLTHPASSYAPSLARI
jgi:hypothetical protein